MNHTCTWIPASYEEPGYREGEETCKACQAEELEHQHLEQMDKVIAAEEAYTEHDLLKARYGDQTGATPDQVNAIIDGLAKYSQTAYSMVAKAVEDGAARQLRGHSI